jgi:hypothetical protein
MDVGLSIEEIANPYMYARNSPIIVKDPTGLWGNFAIGAGVGFVTSSAAEIGGRMASGQSFMVAVKNTYTDRKSLAIIGTSMAIGALTSGTSGMAAAATNGLKSITEVTVKTVAINTVAGAVDAAAKDVTAKAINGDAQSVLSTVKAAGSGAATALVFSGFTQTLIGTGSATTSQITNFVTGTKINIQIHQPNWAGSVGVWGETVFPTAGDVLKEAFKGIKAGEE